MAQAVIDKENPPLDPLHTYCCRGPTIISPPASHPLRVGSLFRVRARRPQAGDEAKTSQLPGSKPMQALLESDVLSCACRTNMRWPLLPNINAAMRHPLGPAPLSVLTP